MTNTNTADRQALRVWLLLAVVGFALSLVGWYRWAGESREIAALLGLVAASVALVAWRGRQLYNVVFRRRNL